MDSVQPEFIKPEHIIEDFIEKTPKFKDRLNSLISDINVFIEASGLEDEVYLNSLSLGYALIDYFEDIRRLKSFHGVEHINCIKIVSYTSYWILKRKPIQLKEKAGKLSIYINERFVVAYILDFLSNDEHILHRELSGLKTFSESLLYHLKYRAISANTIEQIITAFFAGQIYQEKEIDLSSALGKFQIIDTDNEV